MNNYEQFRNMTPEQLAAVMMCPNESGMGLIDCRRRDGLNCYECCLEWLKQPATSCRVCGCTAIAACPGGCYWVERDLCSKCAEKARQAKNAKPVAKAAPRAIKPVPQQPGARTSYKGFLWIECPKCGQSKGFNAKTEISSFYCSSCQTETPLVNLSPLYVNCECGKRFKYYTNLVDSMADIPCLNCGCPVPVMRNTKTGVYETIRQQPRRR